MTVLTALALAVASAFALFVFVNHAGQQLRVGALVDLVGDELRGQLDRRFPAELDADEDTSMLLSRRAGDVIHYDRAPSKTTMTAAPPSSPTLRARLRRRFGHHLAVLPTEVVSG